MTSKAYWKKLSLEFLAKLKTTKKKSQTKILGKFFIIFPGVFSPKYSSDTKWFAQKVVPLTKNNTFLEIGTGSGVIACLAQLNGAKKVVATDINPVAVKNTIINQKKLSLNFSVREGNLFDPLAKNERFEIIFWNHPFNYSEKKIFDNSYVNYSMFDVNYHYLKKFFKLGKVYLKKNGIIILGTSNIARINLIKKIAKKEKYKMTLFDKKTVPIYKNKKIMMDIRLYCFQPI